MIHSLSGRLLILTTIFVMLAEVLIFVPSICHQKPNAVTVMQHINHLDTAHLKIVV